MSDKQCNIRIRGDIPNVLTYSQIRPFIQTGSCILWKGNSIVSKLIRWKSDISHASLCIRLDKYEGLKNRVFLVEALAAGLQLRLLSQRLKEYDGVANFLNMDIPKEYQPKIREFALVACSQNVPYDYNGLFANIFGYVSLDAKAYFCSEFIWKAWEHIGMVDKKHQAPRPDDLMKWTNATLTKFIVD